MRGVYEIRNTLTGEHYVGSSKNIEKRWEDHRQKLRSGTHPTVRLQRAWTEHGEAAFVFDLLEEVPEDMGLLAREAATMERTRPKYNGLLLGTAAIQAAKEMRAAERISQQVHAEAFRAELATVTDAEVQVFACLDCGGLHRLTFAFGHPMTGKITREEVDRLKREYLTYRMAYDGAVRTNGEMLYLPGFGWTYIDPSKTHEVTVRVREAD